MSVIIQPQSAFPIVRQIANHLDSTTYYVRAVIRNASGTIIDTVDLASQGGQRYQTSWRASADTSGQGMYISIVTSVYTDSGFTSKSPDYGDEENTYLVFDRVLPAMRGGGAGLDARTVRRIVAEELEKLPEPHEVVIPPMPAMRWDEILLSQDVLRRRIEAVNDKPAPDFTPLQKLLDVVKQTIVDKPVTPATDITPILARLNDESDDKRIEHDDLISRIDTFEEKITNTITKLNTELPKHVSKVIEDTPIMVRLEPPKPAKQEEKEEVFDISKINL
jgi:hypothetical protein